MLGLFNALTDRERTRRANRQLGCVLAFVAGAINAGGFLAVNRYTSHMTGIISGIADDLVLGELALVLAAIAFLATFIGGAAVCAIMVSWARHQCGRVPGREPLHIPHDRHHFGHCRRPGAG